MFTTNLLKKMFQKADIKTERQIAIEQMQAMQKAAIAATVPQGEFELPPFLKKPAGFDVANMREVTRQSNMGVTVTHVKLDDNDPDPAKTVERIIADKNGDDQYDADNYDTVINTVPGTALPIQQVLVTPIAVDPSKSHVVVIDSDPGQ